MKTYLAFFKQAFKEFGDDKAARLGASLAYYTIFSIAPLLLIAIAVAGMVFGKQAAQGHIYGQLRSVLGPSAAQSIQSMIANAGKPKSGSIATIIGVITLLFGASGVFTQLKDAMNTIWNVEPKPSSGILGAIKGKFLSVGMVFGVGFLLLVSLVVDAAIGAFGKFASSSLPGGEALWQILQMAISLAVVTLLFAMIFRYLPDLKVEWRDVWFGAAFTAFLFVIGKFALGLYLSKAAVGSSFGAAGSLVIILVWVYWSAQILFFGAEFTQVYARNHGSMKAHPAIDKSLPPGKRHTPSAVTVPAPPTDRKKVSKGGGGALKLAAGGIIGMFAGALATVLTAVIATIVVAVKSVRKLF